VVFQLTGSVVFGDWRQISFGLLLAGVTLGLHFLNVIGSRYAPKIPDSYGLHSLGMVVTFVTVFRVNLAWQRYWEALTSVHIMYSKWGDSFMQFATFCACGMEKLKSAKDNNMEQALSKLQNAHRDALKYFSLLSAMASDEIHHGDVQKMDMRLQGSRRSIQITEARNVEIQEEHLTPHGGRRIPDLREGSSSAQVFGESWFDTAYVVKHLPTPAEYGAVEMSPDRVHLCMTWIVKTLTMVQSELNTPPPIQSRMYQELSTGYVHFTNAKKISDVPFPFNYAQLIAIILIIFSLMLPIYVSSLTQSWVAGPILTFTIFHSITCINRLAEILENPFGQDMDDICLVDFHGAFLQMMENTTSALDVSLHPDLGSTSACYPDTVATESPIVFSLDELPPQFPATVPLEAPIVTF